MGVVGVVHEGLVCWDQSVLISKINLGEKCFILYIVFYTSDVVWLLQ